MKKISKTKRPVSAEPIARLADKGRELELPKRCLTR